VRVLAGDVGGTHARLATFRVDDGRPSLVREASWPSEDYDGLAPIVRAFLEQEEGGGDRSFDAACFGVAGPVDDGSVRLPNLGWTLEAAELEEATGIPSIRLLNDFDAIGHGALLLGDDELEVLQEGEAKPGAPIALIGAGTGLGVGHVDPAPDPPRVYSAEGGHAAFAPRNEAEWKLARYLTRKYGRASRERVLSGEGLEDLYHHLVDVGFAPEGAAVRDEIRESDDPAAVVSEHALAEDDLLCERALGLFVEIYGAVAGDVALTVGARGGLFVAGGIAPKILPALRTGRFMDAFLDKGRMRAYVEEIPVRVILDEDVGLRGAARAAAIP